MLALFAAAGAHASTIIVNTVTDAGPANDGVCTFREAIIAANTNAASGSAAGECAAGDLFAIDTIAFNIPGAGLHTLSFASPLPHITGSVTINGLTQPGASANTNPFPGALNASLLIELNLTSAGGSSSTVPSSRSAEWCLTAVPPRLSSTSTRTTWSS